MDTPPTLWEVEKAIHQLSSGKAPGADAIPAEVYKHAGPQLREKMTQLFQAMWTQGAVPQDFKDASVCSNWIPLVLCNNHVTTVY